MSMKLRKHYFPIVNIYITPTFISWENHIVRASDISLVWVGSPVLKPSVHVMLRSGSLLSFAADDATLAMQFYDVVKQLVEGSMNTESRFDAEGILETHSEEKAEEPISTTENLPAISAPQNPLVEELQKLHQCYVSKIDLNREIMQLINDTVMDIKAGDLAKIKASYEKLVTLGVIQDCNELGLHSLIQEIKSHIY